jgi:hypothetical protein
MGNGEGKLEKLAKSNVVNTVIVAWHGVADLGWSCESMISEVWRIQD